MGAALPLLLDLSKDNPILYKDLMPSLVSILKQITEHRLPREYDYHRIPAPWLQMHILRILAILGRGDQATSEGMYEVRTYSLTHLLTHSLTHLLTYLLI